MICILNILFNHPVSEATPNSKITGAYCTVLTDILVRRGRLQCIQRTLTVYITYTTDFYRRQRADLSVYGSVGMYQLIEAGRRGGSSTMYV